MARLPHLNLARFLLRWPFRVSKHSGTHPQPRAERELEFGWDASSRPFYPLFGVREDRAKI